VRKKLLILLLILLCSIQSTFAGTFKDTEAYPWAEEAIENMVNNGYISGYTDGTFRPEKEITRAEFVSVINKMNQLTEASELSFTDVKSTHWAYEQIKIAVAAGYINGYPDGSFRPDALITKEQVAAMFNNLYAFDTASSPHLIKDLSKVSPWAVQAVVNVVSNEVMQLDSEGKFNGKVPAKRVDTVLSMNQIVVKAIAMIGEITQKQPDVQPIVPPDNSKATGCTTDSTTSCSATCSCTYRFRGTEKSAHCKTTAYRICITSYANRWPKTGDQYHLWIDFKLSSKSEL